MKTHEPRMPTDEQRKQFESLITSERFWRQPASKVDPTELLARDDVGGYTNGYIHERWLGWVAGQQARDTEVQRLVAALTSMVVEFDPNSKNEIAAHENAVMLLAEYLPEKEEAVDAD